jgi:hypothetical protein
MQTDKPIVGPFDRQVRHDIADARGLELKLTRYGRLERALFLRHPGEWLAWALRKLADRIDGGTSYAYSGTMPDKCTREDWTDAVEFGACATARFLADVARERRHG